MNASIYRISLDVQEAHSGKTLDVKRGDTGRKLVITLTDGGFPYKISEECYAVFTAVKPDGKNVFNHCAIDGDTIIYELTPQTVAVDGLLEAEIRLYGADDKLLTSACFNLVMNGTVYQDGDEIESETEVEALTHLISEASEVITEGKNVNSRGEEILQELEGNRGELFSALAEAKQAAADAKKSADVANTAQGFAESAADVAQRAQQAAEQSQELAAAFEQRTADALDEVLVTHQMVMQDRGLTAQYASEAKAARDEAAEIAGNIGGGGTPGQDGGYYTPSVTQPDEGTVEFNFTPSREGMPEVPGQSVTLPAGPGGSGIHVGTEEPEDEGVDIWIDPDGEPVNLIEAPKAAAVGQTIVVSAVDENGAPIAWEAVDFPSVPGTLPNPAALTFTGAVRATYDGSSPVSVEIPSGGGGTGLEVLKDITLEESVMEFSDTLDKGYNKLVIYLIAPKADGNTTNNNNLWCVVNGLGAWRFNVGAVSFYGPVAQKTEVDRVENNLFVIKASGAGSSNSSETKIGYDGGAISTFRIYPNTSGESDMIPAGTRLIIQGRVDI